VGKSGGKWEKPASNDVFRGATKVTLDDKGRMVMPNRYRDVIQERAKGQLVVTVDRGDECLLIFPLPDWEQAERKLMSLPSFDARARRLQRLIVGHATDVELDGHGRFLLPPELRKFAGLERLGMLVGLGNRFELWDEARWGERRGFWQKSEEAETETSPLLDSLSL